MSKGFLIRKKISAKDLFQQACWQENTCTFIETPPPSPEEELNQGKTKRNSQQSNVLKEQSMAGPSGLFNSTNNSHSSGKSIF